MPKSLPVSMRLPPEVKAAAEKAARHDIRSLSSFLEKLLTDHLRANGYLTAQETASSLAEQIGDLEQVIADMPADTPPSPQAAMNTMRQALANDDLTQLKNRRTVARRRDRKA